MKVKFNTLVTKTKRVKYSFDKGVTFAYMDNAEALRGGIQIPYADCESLDDIIIAGSEISSTPEIPSDLPEIYAHYHARNLKVKLSNLENVLSSLTFSTTVDDPLVLTISPSGILWTHDELTELNTIISSSSQYIDLRPTDLTHEIEQDIINDLKEDEAGYVGDSFIGYATGDLTTDDLRPFPSIFRNNTQIVGISIPQSDNYSRDDVLRGCTNLQHITFKGSKLWKLGVLGDENFGGEDSYYIWDGMDNFLRKTDDWITILDTEKEFINVLIGDDGGALMLYYDCWVDYEDNPGEYTKEPASNEVEILGVSNTDEAAVLNLGEDIEVETTSVTTESGTEVLVSNIEYDDSVTIENGVINLGD